MELTLDGETIHHRWAVCPRSRALGEGPLLVLSSSCQSNLDVEGSGRRNWKTFVVFCAVCSIGTSISPVWERERCQSGSPP